MMNRLMQIGFIGFGFAIWSGGFAYAQTTAEITGKVSRDSSGRLLVGPDPNDLNDLFRLLTDKQVQVAIRLSKDQVDIAKSIVTKAQDKIRQTIRESQGKVDRAQLAAISRDGNDAARNAVEEILLPEQLIRLRQIVYRIEVETVGWPDAISGGRLADKIGVYENQRTALRDRTLKIVQQMEEKIAQARQEAEKEILKGLTPEQEKIAVESLGDFYEYKMISQEQKMKMQMQEEQEEAERIKAEKKK